VVVHPEWIDGIDTLRSIPGVVCDKSGKLFHNSNLKKFPLRRNKGVTDVHYGLTFGFDNTFALESFLEKITDKSRINKCVAVAD
jgi:hypothetical protein